MCKFFVINWWFLGWFRNSLRFMEPEASYFVYMSPQCTNSRPELTFRGCNNQGLFLALAKHACLTQFLCRLFMTARKKYSHFLSVPYKKMRQIYALRRRDWLQVRGLFDDAFSSISVRLLSASALVTVCKESWRKLPCIILRYWRKKHEYLSWWSACERRFDFSLSQIRTRSTMSGIGNNGV
jgi:hypothetical protein